MTNPDSAPGSGSYGSTKPLYVDLEGALLPSDMLWESLGALLRQRPRHCLLLPLWLLRGRTFVKRRIAARAEIHPEHLPYRRELLEYIAAERKRGRPVVLVADTDARVARRIADHLGCFDDVLVNEGSNHLAGTAKLDAIRAHGRSREGRGGFEYAGSSRADLPIWKQTGAAILVAPSRSAVRGVEALALPHRIIGTARASWRTPLRAMRVYQWAKNALLFVPLLLAHQVMDLTRTGKVFFAFAGFCAVASATYLLNDLVDIEADRRHPQKRMRPFASGALPISTGVILFAFLLAVGFGSSLLLLRPACTAMLAAYLLLTLSYSFYFKAKSFLDVLLLAGLYTHRVLAGAVAAEVAVSTWLLAFSTFFFLSLALVKRYVEILRAQDSNRDRVDRRAYQVGDVRIVETMGLSSGYISVLVLCLFVSSDDVSKLYRTPELLWLMCPVMLYWISRVWFLAARGELHDDPVLFATTDRKSYLAGALIAAVVVAAAW